MKTGGRKWLFPLGLDRWGALAALDVQGAVRGQNAFFQVLHDILFAANTGAELLFDGMGGGRVGDLECVENIVDIDFDVAMAGLVDVDFVILWVDSSGVLAHLL